MTRGDSIVDGPGIDAMRARDDLELEIDRIAPLQRLLLTCDGTLTDLIEVLAREPIRLVKLEHRSAAAPERMTMLELESGEPLIERRVQLQGVRSKVVHVYAEASIAAARLPAPLRRALATSEKPLGRLCKQHRLEIFKEPIDLRCEYARRLSPCLQADPDTSIVSRAYRTFSGGRTVMLIREYFAPALWRIELSEANAPRRTVPLHASDAGPTATRSIAEVPTPERDCASADVDGGDGCAVARARDALSFWL